MRPAEEFPVAVGVGSYHLRPPVLEDVPALEAGISDFSVSRMLARVPWPYPKGAAAGWIEIANARRVNGTGLELVIAGRAAVGAVGFMSFEAEPELGYWLKSALHGRGIMTAAARAAVDIAFARGARAIVSGAFDDNPASLRVQSKLGFEIVGERRVYSLSRGLKLRHIDTRLTRERFSRSA